MRKFRAWDKVNKRMIYDGDVWQPNAQTGLPYLPARKVQVCSHFIVYPYKASSKSYVRVYDKSGKGADYYNDWDYNKLFSNKSELIFQQFTGLCDKNGKKELYACDLLKDKRGNIWEIVWMNKEAGWGINSHSDTGEHKELYPRRLTHGLIIIDGLEKLGTKFESPELLAEQEK